MIRPIITMTVNELAERKFDILMSADDIKEMNKNIRNKAIDEFAKRLKKKVEEKLSLQIFIDEDDLLDKDQVNKYIDEIVEEMKAGGENV